MGSTESCLPGIWNGAGVADSVVSAAAVPETPEDEAAGLELGLAPAALAAVAAIPEADGEEAAEVAARVAVVPKTTDEGMEDTPYTTRISARWYQS